MQLANIKDASPDQLRKLQNKQLEILQTFDLFCEKFNLKYSLAGGSLIGAIRHEGFIPWDDDIDIFMPRPDFEKFENLWNLYGEVDKYTFCRTNRTENYHHPAASLNDNNTTFINKHSVQEDINHGISIDIMPIDAYPNSLMQRILQLIHANIFVVYNTQRLPNNKGRIIRSLTKILYLIVPSKKLRYKLWKNSEKKMSSYSWHHATHATELIGSIRGMFLKHPKSYFDDTIKVKFEYLNVQIMSGYNEYLTRIFGDYMRLPDKKDRKPKHDTVFVDTETSYLHYRGIHYLVKEKM